MSKTLERVEFTTEPSTWIRREPVGDIIFRSSEPYNRITALKIGEKSLDLSCIPTEETEGESEQGRFAMELPVELTYRLSQYAMQLIASESYEGNAYDFTASLLGEEPRDLKETAYSMEQKYKTAEKVPDDMTAIPLGTGLIIAHPNHTMVAPPGSPYFDEYQLPPVGHGPLHIHHSGLSVGEYKKRESYVLHRVALNGALAFDPLSRFRRAFKKSIESVKPYCWKDGKKPTAKDLYLFEMT
jgi:hypothetical protein